MGWSWVVLTLVIQLGSQIIKPRNYMRGKYLTMPLRNRFPRVFNNWWCRMIQIFSLLFSYFVIAAFWHGAAYLYFISLMALAIDDYFADDEDKKRFKEWVRNKVKWKMELPKPVQVKGTA